MYLATLFTRNLGLDPVDTWTYFEKGLRFKLPNISGPEVEVIEYIKKVSPSVEKLV